MRKSDGVGLWSWFGVLVLVAACSDSTPDEDHRILPDAAADRSAAGSGGTGGGAGSGGAGTAGFDAGGGPSDGPSPSDGGTEPITIVSGIGKPTGIALTDTAVYWADEERGTISACPKTGCGANPPVVVATIPAPRGIALRGSTLYIVSNGQADASVPASVKKCTLGSCASGQMIDIGPAQTSGPFGNVGIAADDHNFYVVGGPQGIFCPTSGCADAGSHLFGIPLGPIWGVAVDATAIYFSGLIRGVDTCPLSGGTSPEDETKLVAVRPAMATAVDESNIYWSEYSLFAVTSPNVDAAIRTCARSGCDVASAAVLAAGFIGPYAMAVDDSSLYYTDYRNGRVERISKTSSSASCVANHNLPCEACAGTVRCDGTCSATCDAGTD